MKLTLGELADKLEQLADAKREMDHLNDRQYSLSRKDRENNPERQDERYEAAAEGRRQYQQLHDEVIIDTDDEI